MRHGRLFFMGDAAKVVSPFGARGGNTGIADADNLAWKLAAVLKGRAPASLLDSYHEERHEAARQNVLVTNRTARFLRPADGIERVFRTAALGLARRYPFARQFVNTGRMAVANPYTRSSVCEKTGGLSVQNVAFRWPDGSRGVVNDLLRWADGNLLLLVFGDPGRAGLARLREVSLAAPVRCVQVVDARTPPGALEHVRDPEGHLQGACHVFGHAWALVRPDAYVAATGESIDAAVVQALACALGTTGTAA
jgi:3-(3-hydroxy-phenyl)propionate hydroxylase